MQPNLGQGGCMAIEDAYEFANIIARQLDAHAGTATAALDIPYETALHAFQNERMMRSSTIHGMARMAAIAASTYKAYLGEDMHLEDTIKIPHPGRVAGRVILSATMPLVLGWVLGGNTGKIKVSDRAGYCTLADRPHGFDESEWPTMIADDEALLKASQADWVLVPHSPAEEVRPASLVQRRGLTVSNQHTPRQKLPSWATPCFRTAVFPPRDVRNKCIQARRKPLFSLRS